jgi:hypothetical protein
MALEPAIVLDPQSADTWEQASLLFRVFRFLSRFRRADERTRTAFLLQLRVCGLGLLGVAGVCKSRINKRFSVPCIAHRCRVLHVG